MKYIIFSLLLLALLLTACGPKCSSEEYIELTQPLLEEWDDQVKIANNTSRIALPDQISELQSIARDFNRLELKDCYIPVQDRTVKYMDEIIDAFIAFMSQEENYDNHFRNADQHFDAAMRELRKIDEK